MAVVYSQNPLEQMGETTSAGAGKPYTRHALVKELCWVCFLFCKGSLGLNCGRLQFSGEKPQNNPGAEMFRCFEECMMDPTNSAPQDLRKVRPWVVSSYKTTPPDSV